MTLTNVEIADKFKKQFELIKSKPLQRIVARPFYFIPRMIFSRVYNNLFKSCPLSLNSKLFWGERMKIVLPGDATILHYGIMTGVEMELTQYLLGRLKPGDVFF